MQVTAGIESNRQDGEDHYQVNPWAITKIRDGDWEVEGEFIRGRDQARKAVWALDSAPYAWAM